MAPSTKQGGRTISEAGKSSTLPLLFARSVNSGGVLGTRRAKRLRRRDTRGSVGCLALRCGPQWLVKDYSTAGNIDFRQFLLMRSVAFIFIEQKTKSCHQVAIR